VSAEASASVKLPAAVEASVTMSVGRNWGQNGSHTNEDTVGRDYTSSDTESWALSDSNSHSISKGGQDFWTVTSSTSTAVAFSGDILAGQFAVFYRQTTRLAYPGSVVAYDLCGTPTVVGESMFFDYTWAVELAQGEACPPFPRSSLPAAQCFVSPCSTSP
jgi:hypothetical protein